MSFDWSGYLTLAEYIFNKVTELPEEEAVYRSVVSRAYYAVFCLARNYVKDSDSVEFFSNDHKRLQSHLMNSPHKTKKRLGNQLRFLHQHRIKADYYDKLDELAVNKATRALKIADEIAKDLASLPPKKARS